MPFKKTKEGWVYDPKGKYRLPPAPPAWSQKPKPVTPPTNKKPKVGGNKAQG